MQMILLPIKSEADLIVSTNPRSGWSIKIGTFPIFHLHLTSRLYNMAELCDMSKENEKPSNIKAITGTRGGGG